MTSTFRFSRIAVFLFLLTFALGLLAETFRGTWTAEISERDSQRLQLNLHRRGEHGEFGSSYAVNELSGLAAASIGAANASVSFQLRRDAGTLQFTGEFNKGLGHGEYTFTPNQEYISAMKQMGYSEADSRAFELATLDVSLEFVREIKDLGYKASLDELIQARIFKVGRAQVEGLRAVGITDLPISKLVEYQIFNVTPEYVREMRASFPNISTDKMVEMRIHKATPEFAREMASLGYKDLDADQLVAFRIHGVTPEFIRQVGSLGFKDLSADQLVQFRIFGVNADQINELAKEGYSNLSAEQLVNFRIHRVDTAFIEKVKRAGYAHPSPDELVEYRIMGIRVRDSEE
jgi:hypothetical protein